MTSPTSGSASGDRAVPALADQEALAEALRRFVPHVSALAIVIDDSPSMEVWTPTVDAFRELANAVFGTVNVQLLGSFRDPKGRPAAPDGELVMVISDGLAGFWAHSSADQVLHRWGKRVPVAIVNPYPEDLWHRSLLAPRKVQLSAPRIMSPNAELRVREPSEWISPFDDPVRATAVAVPLLELAPRWLAWWAALVAESATGWLNAVAHIADPGRPHEITERAELFEPTPAATSANRLVRDFRAASSTPAFRLAALMAAAPPRVDLETLRILQGVMLPASRPLHLAEVVTSPLLVTGAGGGPSFRPGVREELLAHTTRDDTVRVIELVAAYFGERFPRARALLHVLRAPDQRPLPTVSAGTLEEDQFELNVLQALAGPYDARAALLEEALSVPGIVPAPSTPPMSTVSPLQTGPHLLAGQGASQADLDALLQPDAESAVWVNLPPRNTDFTGREDLLEILDFRLRHDRVAAVLSHSLHGMGGVGKSQIATEYAYRHLTHYDVIWFVPSEQESQIRRSLMDLGERLDVQMDSEPGSAVQAVLEALTAGAPYPNWLLIFDNAESIETVERYLPQGGTGKVLVTSRNRQWHDTSETLEIDIFSREESIALLRKRNPDLSAGDADRLADLLDDLPLAIAQAATWQATMPMPVGEYIGLLARKRDELTGRRQDPHYEIAVATAWTVALEHLGAVNPGALQLLQACSFMAPEPISQEIFRAARNIGFTEELTQMLQNPTLLNRAIQEIEQYGLARIDYREQTLTVQLHRLVREVVVDQLTAENRGRMQHVAHLLLAGGNPGDITQRARYHALLPHVLASDQVSCEDAWARALVLDLIAFLHSVGDHEGCRSLAAQAVERWTVMLGPDDDQVLKGARWLAFIMGVLGEFTEAARINADCLERLRALKGPEDEETLDAINQVAVDLRAAGDFSGAVQLGQGAYEVSQRIFGPNIPHTLNMAHGLGISLRMMGDFPAAMALDMDTVRRRIEVLGPRHFLTLLSQNGLTLDLRERGDYIGANQQQERLYERTQRILGLKHPQTLMAARNLAVSLRRAGYHARARKLALATLTELRRRFGDLYPEAIACALNYAVDLRENDELDESLLLADRTWQEYRQALGDAHPYTLSARTNLGIVLRLLGDLDTAVEHDRSAYEELRDLLGSRHVLTLAAATNLASDLFTRGDPEEAYALDAETLRHSGEILGSEHPSTLAVALNMAFDLRALGRTGDGDRLFGEVIDAYDRVLGPRHPAIAAARAGMRANCDVDPMPL
ncbi:FxSxx-COOH system tetratricopeptide repeat protein [Actinoplanes couchii]|uniref:Cytochrome c n=1 Tax=Actinoplanes couchii TaxID=403638 RepID=A0ABQ3X2F3_9ACTN|nr:FxSxx-COOH system tetratricopeptide repeat protein [Actinoplanes couchii]MDR6322419.1 tetratricopeptide (TPR) repeat protein [Actinoplanes couchii]GID52652.1 cytochrome c [Actinoplanes couchii]